MAASCDQVRMERAWVDLDAVSCPAVLVRFISSALLARFVVHLLVPSYVFRLRFSVNAPGEIIAANAVLSNHCVIPLLHFMCIKACCNSPIALDYLWRYPKPTCASCLNRYLVIFLFLRLVCDLCPLHVLSPHQSHFFSLSKIICNIRV